MSKTIKRILFITEDFPSGLNGTSVKTRSTLEYLLSQDYKIDVCCFHFDTFKIHNLQHKNLQVHTIKTNRVNKKSLIFAFYVLSLLFGSIPISIRRLFNNELKKKIFNLTNKTRYKAVIYDGYSTLQYMNSSFKGEKIYVDDEDFTDLYRQRFLLEKRISHKLFYAFEYCKSLIYEHQTMKKVSQVWAISPRTKERLEKVSGKPTVLMPTLIFSKKNIYTGKGTQIVFTGTLNWRENVEGLKWFVNNHWQKIITEVPKAKLVVIGQGASQELITFLKSYKNIEYKGYVESLEDEYKKSVLSIAPVRINAGIKVKILTYMSYALPVISTHKAAWGLVSLDGIKIAEDIYFADEVIKLLKDKKLRQALSEEAHKNIKKNYSRKVLHQFFLQNLK